MLREYEVQESICEGVARVLRGEVNTAMLERGRGQRRGVRFDIVDADAKTKGKTTKGVTKPGFCAGCGEPFREYGKPPLSPSFSSSK